MWVDRKLRRRAFGTIAAATVMLFSLGEGTAFAKSCASEVDYAALSLRVLQSDLMVAGLRCREHGKFASFVQKFGPELRANGGTLKKFFSAQYGGKGNNQLDLMVTRLANNSSSRAGVDTHSYCRETVGMFDEVLSVKAAEIKSYAAARPAAGAHGYKRCSTVKLVEDAIQIPGAKKNTKKVND